MDIDQSYRDAMATQLSRRLAQALQADELSTEDISAAAQFILEKINTLQTHQDVLSFLTEISGKWPIFTDYLTREKLRTTKNEEQKIANVEAALEEQEDIVKLTQKGDANGGN